MSAPPQASTADRATRGAAFLYVFRWLDRVLGFLSVVVLARLLSEEDFGVVAIAASVVAILEGLSDFDVGKAIIRLREEGRDLLDTAWTLALLRGLTAAALMLAAAPFVSDERIREILIVLAAAPVLTGLASPRFVTFERDLDYSRVAWVTLSAKLVSFVVTIALAFAGAGAWALVLGILANALATTALTYVFAPHWPRPTFARFRDLFAFTGWMSVATAITTLSMQTDRILVGRLAGVAEAGSYFMTQRVGSLPTAELISPLQRVLFPAFRELSDDAERLRRAVLEMVNVHGAMSLPAGVGFAFVAPEVVPLLLGERWLHLVPLLQVLVPYLGVRAVLSMTLPCVLALGRTQLLAGVSAAYAFVHLPLFIAGTVLYGLPGAIGAVVLAGVVYTALNAWMLGVTVGVRLRDLARELARPGLAAAAMAAVLALGSAPATAALGAGSWGLLALKVVVGAAVFLAVLFLLWQLQGRPRGAEGRAHHVLRQRFSR